jgi:hypothetical protein
MKDREMINFENGTSEDSLGKPEIYCRHGSASFFSQVSIGNRFGKMFSSARSVKRCRELAS